MLLAPGISRIEPVEPIEPGEPKAGELFIPKRGLMPPDIDDAPPDIGERLKDVRAEPSDEVPRDGNERLLLPLMRAGMKPPNIPA